MTNDIKCSYSDSNINDILNSIDKGSEHITRHYNQGEEFFVKVKEDFSVPSLPIHHDVRKSMPNSEYLDSLKNILNQLIPLAPQVFEDLTYLFDPGEILKPCFFKLYRIEGKQYLYMLRLDLMHRPQVFTLLERGGNDFTAQYLTNILFFEADFIPLSGVVVDNGKIRSFQVEQTLSSTWVDEVGRGYFVQGIWIDNELTKFFSKLLLPQGKRTYPYYPYICKYKTICQTVIHFSSEARKKNLPYLHRVLNFMQPVMNQIEASMKDEKFSEENQTFKQLKKKVPESWYDIWKSLNVELYLNDQDMREFSIED